MTTTAAAIQHWDSKTCPFAQRSWITLLLKGLPFEIHEVDLSNKSEEFKDLYASITHDKTAAAKVPILVDADGTKLIESLVVAEYLDDKYPEPPLLPRDAAGRARARLFIDASSSFVGGAYGVLLERDPEAVKAKIAALPALLAKVDSALRTYGSPDGSGPFLFGESLTLADISLITHVQRARVTLKRFRDVDLDALLAEPGLGRFKAWVEAGIAHPAVVETSPSDETIYEGVKRMLDRH